MSETDTLDSQDLPMGDAFGGEEPAPAEPDRGEETWPAGEPPNEPGHEPDHDPDLTEQQRALEAKVQSDPEAFAQAVAAKLQEQQQPMEEPGVDPDAVFEAADGTLVDGAGNPVEVDEDGNVYDAEETTGDPRLDAVLGYLSQKQETEQAQAMDSLAETYSDLDSPEGIAEVEQRLGALAERGVDVRDPLVTEMVLEATRSSRAPAPSKPAEEIRNEGASLPVDAGVSGGAGKPSPDEAWWQEVRGASSSPWD